MENILPHVHGWNSFNGCKIWMKAEHQGTFWIQLQVDELFG
jgi:hypothetical protein